MKIKNMIYLTISYIPWVVYWTISAQIKLYGGIVAFVLELILIGIQRRNKNYSFMDFFSMLYFIITIIANYIINTNYFVIGDGYFGYAALFIMSVISMLIKRPFMGYYVKRDCKSNSVVDSKIDKLTAFQTKVWTVVFFINIWVFVFLHEAAVAVTTSQVFVTIGIILSIYNERALNDTYILK